MRKALPPVVIGLVGLLVAFGDALVGRVPTMRDFVGFTIPLCAGWRRAFSDLDFSAWNPLAGIGLPRLVNGAFYPGHLLLFAGKLETAVGVTWLAHVAWAMAGGYAMARELRVRPAAALVAGAVWALGGNAVSMWWNGEKVLADAWLPWFAVAAVRAVRSPKGLGGAALTTAMVGLLDPFSLLDAIGLAAATIGATRPEAGQGSKLRALARPLVGWGLGLALAAPALLPGLLLRGDTPRAAALSRTAAEAWSMHPVRLPELFVPGWFGNPLDVEHYAGGIYASDPTVQALPWAVSLYAGAAVAVFAPLARGRRVVLWLAATATVFLLLAFGGHTPVDELARHVVPGLSLARYPEKHAVVVVGLLAVLAAVGVERALSSDVPWWRVAAVPGVLLLLAWVSVPAALRSGARAGVVHAALGVSALVAMARVGRVRPWFAWGIALVSVLDLAVAARPELRWAPSPIYAGEFAAALPSRPDAAPPRLYRPREGDFENGVTLPDNAAQVLGVGTLPGHDPARSPRLDALAEVLSSRDRDMATLLALDARMVSDGGVTAGALRVHDKGWSLYASGPTPRAWVVGHTVRAPLPEALALVASDGFELTSEAVVSAPTEPALEELEAAPRGAVGTCEVESYSRARVALQCDAQRPGLAVIAEMEAEGWHALLDGREVAILATDVALRGVALGPGRHEIEMRYETPGLVEGVLVALLAALVLLLAFVRTRRLTSSGPA